jgi:NAD(P)-dependent dehydrogenase (short-subunit alcohol dehydrogenase family)
VSSGLQTAAHLLAHGARVYLGARSVTKYNAALSEIKSHPSMRASKTFDCDAHMLLVDHLDLKSVVKAADDLKAKENQLHCLVNNAGIMASAYEKTADGYESQWQVSYTFHFLRSSSLFYSPQS